MLHLFKDFMVVKSEYAKAEAFWLALWNSIPSLEISLNEWRPNWFISQTPKDANPIFSAVSEKQKKGMRIIQYESTSEEIEFDFWLDTFGGPATDPTAIRELVIACALSPESSQAALRIISSWISGEIELRPQWPDYVSESDFVALTRAA